MRPTDILRRRSVAKRSGGAEDVEPRHQLRLLVADPRYRDDADFKHYVRRQHQRVFNDASGRLLKSRDAEGTGRPPVEPFDRYSERALRLQDEALPTGTRPPSSGHRGPAARMRPGSRDVFPPEDRASESLPELPPRDLSHVWPGQTLKAIDAMISAGRKIGYTHAAEHLAHYRHGKGTRLELPWSVLRSARYLAAAEQRVLQHYEDWFIGALEDSRLGQPFLGLRDGQSIVVGQRPHGRPPHGLVWEADVGLQSHGSTIEQDLNLAIGRSKIQGFGTIRFTRVGQTIKVEGTVDLQLSEIYNFEPGLAIGWANAVDVDGPDTGSGGLIELARRGIAAPFETYAHQPVAVTGEIVLDADGRPDPERSDFSWQDVEP